ncbi:MAG: hypothetical protein H6659_07430 [Ardenticatenaceae bacterium]|nr:hypothetical protein [Ardenticatenaceae bacterium]
MSRQVVTAVYHPARKKISGDGAFGPFFAAQTLPLGSIPPGGYLNHRLGWGVAVN